MVDVQPAAMNWGLEDELYMDRRHAVAMEGLEEELEEGEVPPLVDEEEFINQLNALHPKFKEISQTIHLRKVLTTFSCLPNWKLSIKM